MVEFLAKKFLTKMVRVIFGHLLFLKEILKNKKTYSYSIFILNSKIMLIYFVI